METEMERGGAVVIVCPEKTLSSLVEVVTPLKYDQSVPFSVDNQVIDITSPEQLDEHLKHYFDEGYRDLDHPILNSGYEAGFYYIRLVHNDIRLSDFNSLFKTGYQLLRGKNILYKHRKMI